MYTLMNMKSQDVHLDVATLNEFDDEIVTLEGRLDSGNNEKAETTLTNKQFDELSKVNIVADMLEADELKASKDS